MVEKLLPIERLDVGLGDLVVTAVREAISAGSLAAGQRITERELVERTGVSRASVREAVRQLRQMGLLESPPRGGLRVAPLDRDAIAYIYEVRIGVELLAVELFTLRATDQQIHEWALSLSSADLIPGAGVPEISCGDELLCQGSGNPLLWHMVQPYHARVRSLQRLSLSLAGRWEKAHAEIAAISTAVRKRDVAGAVRGVRSHLEEAQRASLVALVGCSPT
ncbi:GntR family transcriptional regulator [Microbacterium aurantiacum]|uniref:HTH gntR-type domain-containing protein n=1 Tax=Microbacterium aurantiacum TaxID=162393 RepID=A0A0M8MF59_9MICO|nr:GntR family transcriptional regulator [Microbacterium chocolatum]ANG85484.1 hypothetical protein A8L33_08880 [Microbacterium chocolatum]KOS11226.1 hypothetical protein XI38_04975 [Microbacterium chocolatum]